MRPHKAKLRKFKIKANDQFDRNGHLLHRRSEGLTRRRNKGSYLQDPWQTKSR